MRSAAVVLALLLPLAACGGGSDESADRPTATAPTTSAAAGPTTAPTDGVPVPEALSGFRCEETRKNGWKASGRVANDGKAAQTYQVTVYVGPADGAPGRAKTRRLADVAAGGSVAFSITKVPAPDDGATCHVQVLATR